MAIFNRDMGTTLASQIDNSLSMLAQLRPTTAGRAYAGLSRRVKVKRVVFVVGQC
jgi:hypothetical protein